VDEYGDGLMAVKIVGALYEMWFGVVGSLKH
jgi:hypothetical protein